MSRSWTSALTRGLPRGTGALGGRAAVAVRRYATWVETLGTGGGAAGLALRQRSISCARTTPEGNARRVQWVKQRDLPLPFFAGVPTVEHVAALAGALKELCAPMARSYIPIYMTLPDPAARFTVFELEQLPQGTRAQTELARFRYGKEVFHNGAAFECVSQYLGEADGKFLLLGLAADRGWLGCVEHALQQAGVTPWGMNMSACYQFNRFHSVVTAEYRGGALISLDRDAWTLSIWDPAGRLRFVRSRWRARPHGAAFYDDIAAESERTILAYVRGDAQRAIARLYVSADPEDQDELVRVLNGYAKDGVTALSLADGVRLVGDAGTAAAVDPPLAAALAQ